MFTHEFFTIFFAAAVLSTSAYAENMLISSNDLAAKAWSAQTGIAKSAKVTKSIIPAPDGTKTAFLVDISDGYLGQKIVNAKPGNAYRFSVWLRSPDSEETIVQLIGENHIKPRWSVEDKKFIITNHWERVSIVFECSEKGNEIFSFSFRTGKFLAWHPQVEDVTGKTSPGPGKYVAGSEK